MKTKLRVITNSQVRTKRRCDNEHYIAYELGYRPVVTEEALYFGDLLHKGLEAWWKAAIEDRLLSCLSVMKKYSRNDYDLAKAAAMMQGYDARWGRIEYQVHSVEYEGYAPLINPETGNASKTHKIGFKLDVLVLDPKDQKFKYIEHKTSSHDISPGTPYWRRLLLDSQVSTYDMGANANGFEVSECIYDVLLKPQQRPGNVPLVEEGCKVVLDKNGQRVRTAKGKWRETADTAQGYVLQTRPETPDEYHLRIAEHITENVDKYYQRMSIVRLEEEKEDAERDLWYTVEDIARSRISGRHPRNPDACERYGRMCAYFDVCTRTASLEDTTRFVRVDNVHQELENIDNA